MTARHTNSGPAHRMIYGAMGGGQGNGGGYGDGGRSDYRRAEGDHAAVDVVTTTLASGGSLCSGDRKQR